ncbi:MAG: hypothetical protein WCG21_00010 [Eubacteriales bacterium]
MPRKLYTDFCPISGDQRTITVDLVKLSLSADSSSEEMKCGFECDKYLYGHCPSEKDCPLYKKAE